MLHSYHIFYFPFKWEIPEKGNELFSDQVNLDNIIYSTYSNWEHVQEPKNESEKADLYNEKNYYYQFVHQVLYDETAQTNIIKHFERKEPALNNVYYKIKVKNGKLYTLSVDSINLNFYSTGVGILSFFLKNEDDNQKAPEDILCINQFGRRILPPFYADIYCRRETAEYISIDGLNDMSKNHTESFDNYSTADSWKVAGFVSGLINEIATNIEITPVIDDRMFVSCMYKNDSLASKFNSPVLSDKDSYKTTMENEKLYLDTFMNEPFWYKFLFIDNESETCQNLEMKAKLLDKSTYKRWQKEGSLYGATRYSLMLLANNGAPDFILSYFQTTYSRMVELVLVQRASMLRFSGEVTKVSKLSNKETGAISNRISSLYKEYIRFVNQIYFREVTAQDQGIELYELLHDNLKMEEYIKDLEGEVGELHQYVSLMEDREGNKEASKLNMMAAILLPATILTGMFGMNKLEDLTDNCCFDSLLFQLPTIIIVTVFGYLLINKNKKK